MSSFGYCIFIDTLCEGPVPVERDGDGKWIIYETQADAEIEIYDYFEERYRQYLEGEREFEDVAEIEEIIYEVKLLSDGSVVDEWGRVYKP